MERYHENPRNANVCTIYGNVLKMSAAAWNSAGFFRQRLHNFALVNIQSKIQILVLTARSQMRYFSYYEHLSSDSSERQCAGGLTGPAGRAGNSVQWRYLTVEANDSRKT